MQICDHINQTDGINLLPSSLFFCSRCVVFLSWNSICLNWSFGSPSSQNKHRPKFINLVCTCKFVTAPEVRAFRSKFELKSKVPEYGNFDFECTLCGIKYFVCTSNVLATYVRTLRVLWHVQTRWWRYSLALQMKYTIEAILIIIPWISRFLSFSLCLSPIPHVLIVCKMHVQHFTRYFLNWFDYSRKLLTVSHQLGVLFWALFDYFPETHKKNNNNCDSNKGDWCGFTKIHGPNPTKYKPSKPRITWKKKSTIST